MTSLTPQITKEGPWLIIGSIAATVVLAVIVSSLFVIIIVCRLKCSLCQESEQLTTNINRQNHDYPQHEFQSHSFEYDYPHTIVGLQRT